MSYRTSDDEFRTAVADPSVRTVADLCRRLGLVPRGANYEGVRDRAERLGIDLTVLEAQADGRAGRRSWTDAQLLAALEDPAVDGYPALCAALDLMPHHGSYARLRRRAAELGRPLPAPWSRPGPRGGHERPLRLERAQVIAAVAASSTRREILERLGIRRRAPPSTASRGPSRATTWTSVTSDCTPAGPAPSMRCWSAAASRDVSARGCSAKGSRSTGARRAAARRGWAPRSRWSSITSRGPHRQSPREPEQLLMWP